MRVATWNVLHRIHAMNWSEPAIAAHPDEAARIAALTARIVELGDVVCLQEVSGDQLASLRAAFPAEAVHVHVYPRVPRLYRAPPDAVSPLADSSEQLVTIAQGGKRVLGETFPSDKGKGLLIVEVGDIAVINTHVTWGDHAPAQCARLAAAASAYAAVVIVGDFNDDRARCSERLGPAFVPGIPGIEKPTRPRTDPKAKSEVIDHVFASGCTVTSTEVLAGGGLSDHNPVAATVR